MHEYEVDEDEHGVIAWTYINIVIGSWPGIFAVFCRTPIYRLLEDMLI